MRCAFLLLAFALIAFSAVTPVTRSSPVDGIFARKVDVPAEGLTVVKRFRGGERASVQVIGDHKSTTMVTITVHDEKKNVVAEDKGREQPVGDISAVIWYPPRDGEYRITIRNSDSRAARYFVAIR
jgi:hypothetical protein